MSVATLDGLTDEDAFEEVLRRAKANTAGKRWLFVAGGVRCEDERCPLEAAANVERGNLKEARRLLWPATLDSTGYLVLDAIIAAADTGIGGERVTRWRMRLIRDLLTEVPW